MPSKTIMTVTKAADPQAKNDYLDGKPVAARGNLLTIVKHSNKDSETKGNNEQMARGRIRNASGGFYSK